MTRNIDLRISKSRALLKDPYAYLNGEGEYEAIFTAQERLIDPAQVMKGYSRGRPFPKRDLELIARTLQRLMWLQRKELL